MKLLLIEDDRMFAELIRRALREDGHAVDVAYDAAEGRTLAFVNEYDGIVLDVMLPDGSGLQIVHELRRDGRDVPVLLLTGKNASTDVVRGLDAGADDYITKPLDLDQFRARIRALLRRGGARRMERVDFASLSLDRLSRRAVNGTRDLSLTPREYSLLEYLLLNAERIVRRSELLEKVWESTFDPGSNVVDVHVARLRGKLHRAGSTARLETVRGTGFKLTCEPAKTKQGSS